MRLPLAAGSFWGGVCSNRRNLARSVLLIAKPAPLPPLIRDLPQCVAYRICTYVYTSGRNQIEQQQMCRWTVGGPFFNFGGERRRRETTNTRFVKKNCYREGDHYSKFSNRKVKFKCVAFITLFLGEIRCDHILYDKYQYFAVLLSCGNLKFYGTMFSKNTRSVCIFV